MASLSRCICYTLFSVTCPLLPLPVYPDGAKNAAMILVKAACGRFLKIQANGCGFIALVKHCRVDSSRMGGISDGASPHAGRPEENELAFCGTAARAPTTRLGFVVLLKTFQRLGYFVLSSQVPEPLIRHIAQSIGRNADLINLNHYDHLEARRKHVGIIRRFLDVNPLTATGKLLLRNTFIEVALIKEDVADIINVGIEVLIRHRYELPAFDSLVRTPRSARAEANQALYSRVQTAVGKEGAAFLDVLFVVGDDPRRVCLE